MNILRRMTVPKLQRMVLKPTKPDDIQVKGLVFDMDGTLSKPQVCTTH